MRTSGRASVVPLVGAVLLLSALSGCASAASEPQGRQNVHAPNSDSLMVRDPGESTGSSDYTTKSEYVPTIHSLKGLAESIGCTAYSSKKYSLYPASTSATCNWGGAGLHLYALDSNKARSRFLASVKSAGRSPSDFASTTEGFVVWPDDPSVLTELRRTLASR